MDKKIKKLVLKRGYFQDGYNGSVEQLLTGINDNLSRHEDRVHDVDLFRSYILADIESPGEGKGLFVRVLAHEKGTTGLINFETSQEKAEVEEFQAPEKRGFLDDEVIVYVNGNHIVACGLGRRDTLLQNILYDLGEKAGVVDNSLNIKISDVPNKTELSKAQEIGIKKVDFSIKSFLANLENFPDENKKSGDVISLLSKVFGVPDTVNGLKKRANTSGRVILSRGKFKKEEIHKDEWLTDIGAEVIENDLEDYTIVLEDGSKISSSTLKVTKSVKINKFANSISYDGAKAELAQFYKELETNGSLDW